MGKKLSDLGIEVDSWVAEGRALRAEQGMDAPSSTRRPMVRARLHPVMFARLMSYVVLSGRSVSEVIRDGLERVLPTPEGLS